MATQVLFKDEGHDGREPIGPVKVIDTDARDADPNVKGFGMPFGYQPP